jgi:serine-type D-Ala-D-Ala carboxypeptidase/endopeptidase
LGRWHPSPAPPPNALLRGRPAPTGRITALIGANEFVHNQVAEPATKRDELVTTHSSARRRHAPPWLAALLLLTHAASGAALAQRPDWAIPSNEDIRALLAKRMEHNGVGVVVGVIEPAGRRVVAYGRSGAADGRPLDGDTIFQIGSVSKSFVALVLADMVLKGEVKLDDPAAKYLPAGVKMPQRGRPITLVDLSLHMSGLPRMPTNFDLRGQPDPIEAYSVEDLYRFLSTYVPLRAPGVSYEYSNLGASLLGRLLGLRVGKEYEELVKERVLAPLGMTSTSVHLSSQQMKRLAPGHSRDLLPMHSPEMKTLYPSGSLRSSANDLLRFLAANLGYQDTPLKRAMTFQLTVPTVPATTGPQVPGAPQQTLGWKLRHSMGRALVYHDGDKDGYRAVIAFDPERRTGVVVLANALTDDAPQPLARHLLTGEPMSPPPPAMAARAFARFDDALLDSYEGEYRVGDSHLFRVARRRDHLLIDEVSRGPEEYFAESPRDFITRADKRTITFRTNAAGKVTGMAMYPRGRGVSDEPLEGVRVER